MDDDDHHRDRPSLLVLHQDHHDGMWKVLNYFYSAIVDQVWLICLMMVGDDDDQHLDPANLVDWPRHHR